MKYNLSRTDINKWFFNIKLFAAPLALMYLLYVANNIQTDGFTVSDFYLSAQMQGALMLYLLNTLIDIIKKFLSTSK